MSIPRPSLRRAPSPVPPPSLILLALAVFALCRPPAALAEPDGASSVPAASTAEPRADLQLLLVVDGLRPDYVTAERMPALHALAARGVFFEKHHSAYPTVTRVNSATFATGMHPGGHGILGNTIYVPAAAPRPLNTSDLANLQSIDAASVADHATATATAGELPGTPPGGGGLLTARTLAERLADAGKKFLAIGSGSEGAAFLLNPRVAGLGVLHNDFGLPASLHARAVEVLGPPPADRDSSAKVRRAIDSALRLGIDELHADVLIVWITDPDGTAHATGMGSPQTEAALRNVDAEIARLIDGLRERGLLERTNLLVGSDHGFSTHRGPWDLVTLLVQAGLKSAPDSDDVIVADGAIYLSPLEEAASREDRDARDERIRAIVELLQRTSWVGPIFTRRVSIPGHPEGHFAGTLSFEAARWKHARSADILVGPNWGDEANEAGFAGWTTQKGVAGHGSSSPWDIHNTLIAAGPGFKVGLRNAVPSGNVDLAPTLLALCGVAAPRVAEGAEDGMDGRVLKEALAGGPDPATVKVDERATITRARHDGFEYRLELHESGVDGTDYIDMTRTIRNGDPR